MVKSSWEILKQDIPHHSIQFFSKILDIAPATKDMFSFLKDSDMIPQDNPRLKAHAVKAFKMVVKEAPIKTLKVGVGEKWSEEMGNAWCEAYDQLAATIKAKMKEEVVHI